MEHCPVCCSKNFGYETLAAGGILYKLCTECSFLQMDRRFFLSSAEECRRYELHENSITDAGYVSWLEKFLVFSLDGLEPENSEGSCQILDFGSGPEPVMASLLRRKGYQVTLEDPYFAPGRKPGPFNLVTAMEVFEHLKDPSGTLMDISSRLIPGGSICISTEFLPTGVEAFDSWHYRSDPTHISFFSIESLHNLAEKTGLIITDHDSVRYVRMKLPCPG